MDCKVAIKISCLDQLLPLQVEVSLHHLFKPLRWGAQLKEKKVFKQVVWKVFKVSTHLAQDRKLERVLENLLIVTV